MPSCRRAAAPGLWLVALSIHFMLLCSLIRSVPAPGSVAPPIQLAGIEAPARRQDPESQDDRSTKTGSFRRLKKREKKCSDYPSP